MTAARFRAVVAVAAAVVLGLLGWLLGGGGAGGPTGGEEANPGGRPKGPIVDAPPPDAPRVEGARPAAAPAGKPAGADAAEDAGPATPEEAVEGVCLLEDGTPLPGVTLLAKGVTRSDNVPLSRGPVGRPVETASDGNGVFRMDARAAKLHGLEPHIPHAVLVAAEGGSLVSDGRQPPYVRVEADRLRLSFRDVSGWAQVRLLNAETGEPVTDVAGLRVAWHVRGGLLTIRTAEDPGLGGWIAIPEGRLPETGGADRASIEADLSKVEVEFAMPGYEKAQLPLQDIHGRMQVRVRPVPADARGEIAVPFDVAVTQDKFEENPGKVSAHLRWTGPDPAPAMDGILGLPTRAGPFSLYGIPDGPWVIEVASTLLDNTVVRGKRAFERHGDTVDLGKIELKEAGKVVLRVVDAAGEGIPQAWAVVVRPEEDPDQGRRLDLDAKGMVAVGDLEPGIAHRAVVKGLPQPMEKTVTAEAKPRAVDFQWPEKLVPCRIALLVDGKGVANPDGRTTIPAVVQDSPLPRDKGAWKPDGTFEAKLVPGTYRFSVLATPKEGGALALFAGDVTVPSGDSFDTRVELQREAR